MVGQRGREAPEQRRGGGREVQRHEHCSGLERVCHDLIKGELLEEEPLNLSSSEPA